MNFLLVAGAGSALHSARLRTTRIGTFTELFRVSCPLQIRKASSILKF